MIIIPQKPQGALTQTPTTFNQQPGTNFKFNIKRFPDVNYYVFRMNVPAMTLPLAPEATPFVMIPKPGAQTIFDPLIVEFRVEEGLKNYTMLGDWMKIISSLYEPGPLTGADFTPPNPKSPYDALAQQQEWTGQSVQCEILAGISDSARNINLNVTYHDAWPTQLSALVFDSTPAQVDYLKATVTFRYSFYEFTQAS